MERGKRIAALLRSSQGQDLHPPRHFRRGELCSPDAAPVRRNRVAAVSKANIAPVGDGLDRPETYDIRERKKEKTESSKPFPAASKAKLCGKRKAVRDDVGIVPYGVRRMVKIRRGGENGEGGKRIAASLRSSQGQGLHPPRPPVGANCVRPMPRQCAGTGWTPEVSPSQSASPTALP